MRHPLFFFLAVFAAAEAFEVLSFGAFAFTSCTTGHLLATWSIVIFQRDYNFKSLLVNVNIEMRFIGLEDKVYLQLLLLDNSLSASSYSFIIACSALFGP